MRDVSHGRNRWVSRAGTALLLFAVLAVPLDGCGAVPTQSSQSPSVYLRGALDWIGAHSSRVDHVPWVAIRKQATQMARHAHTTSQTYPAIVFALERLHDPLAFFLDPRSAAQGRDDGLSAIFPGRLVVDVEPGSPAQRAGVRIGDLIKAVDGKKSHPFQGTSYVDLGRGRNDRLTVLHPGRSRPVSVTFEPASIGHTPCTGVPHGRDVNVDGRRLGYIALPLDCGSASYPGVAQRVLKTAAPACGWLIDLRQNVGGDIWTYLAAIGPILGNGRVGGFVYPDGTREWWEYRDGKVYWNGQERGEDRITGPRFRVTGPPPPVAVLTSRATTAAAELLAVAFHGRPHTRFFGEPTRGAPSLFTNTVLSDGALIFMSGAGSFDRTGRIYRGHIVPDVEVHVDWADLGKNNDLVLHDAARWLVRQSGCA